MEKMQRVRFSHPLSDAVYETDLPVTTCFRELSALLVKAGFLEDKRGGYHFIIDDRMCARAAALEDYLPEPAPETLDVRVHGLLTILI